MVEDNVCGRLDGIEDELCRRGRLDMIKNHWITGKMADIERLQK